MLTGYSPSARCERRQDSHPSTLHMAGWGGPSGPRTDPSAPAARSRAVRCRESVSRGAQREMSSPQPRAWARPHHSTWMTHGFYCRLGLHAPSTSLAGVPAAASERHPPRLPCHPQFPARVRCRNGVVHGLRAPHVRGRSRSAAPSFSSRAGPGPLRLGRSLATEVDSLYMYST